MDLLLRSAPHRSSVIDGYRRAPGERCVGGIFAATVIPAPMWFIALDLVVAYIPMAYFGWLIAARK